MKAMLLQEFNGPRILTDLPVPQPGPEEALLRVKACAVDQFDLTIRAGKFPSATTPIVLGHEIAGEIVSFGENVTGLSPGDRVVCTLYLTCGRCRYCNPGR